MLNAIDAYYKPTGSELYTELVRQLHNININLEKDVRQYEKDFRKVNVEIVDLNDSLSLSESYLIQLFLMRFDETYDVFMITYIQTHVLYNPDAVKFDLITHDAVNEERRMLVVKENDVVMLAHRNGNDKNKQSVKGGFGGSDSTNRETCAPCKAVGRKFKHLSAKCWIKFPHLKPEKFMSEQEKKKKAQIDAIHAGIDALSAKRKRIEEAPFNASASGEDDYLNANMAYAPGENDYLHAHMTFLNELDDQSHPDLTPDDFNILGAATQADQDEDEDPISLIADPDLDKSLSSAKSMDLDTRIVIDSGCTRHSFADRSIFTTYIKVQSRSIKGIEDVKVQPLVCGIINLDCNVNDKRVTLTIPNVLHVPDMGVNLLSVGKLLNVDIEVAFYKKDCALIQGNITLIGTRNRDLFFLNLWKGNSALAAYSVLSDPIHQLWHARMGHLNQQNLNKLLSIAVNVDFFKDIVEEYTCECCVMGRQKATSHNNPTAPDTLPSEFVYNDLVGSLTPTGFNGYKYFVTFKDDFTCYSEIYCIRHKSETFVMFLRFKAYLESRGYRINRIRLDNENEYINKAFLECLAQMGIKQEPTITGNPEMNETVERFDQTLMNKVHPILLSFSLNKSFWPEIMITANYLTMRSPNIRTIATPFEAFYHRKPILFHLRTIDSIVYALRRIQKKLVNKSEKCILLGYEGESIFRLYNLTKKKVIRVNDVHFVEKRPHFVNLEKEIEAHEPSNKRQRLSVPASATREALNKQRITVLPDVEPVTSTKSPNRLPPADIRSPPAANRSQGPHFVATAVRVLVTFIRPAAPIARPVTASPSSVSSEFAEMRAVREHPEYGVIQKVLDDHRDLTISDLRDLSPDPLTGAFAAFALLANHTNKPDIFEPTTYEQAISNGMSRMNWELGMRDEYKSLMDNNTWCLVQTPPRARVLRGR